MEEIYIMNSNFGKCTVVCFYKDVAILKLERNYEKYVVVIGLSIKENRWDNGYYYRKFKDAARTFNMILKKSYLVSFIF